jgi:MarR family transcriptional regulator, organic hydroperoxide resistance regulator
MERKDVINELVAIEMRMVEARNLFANIADRMQERSVGILGFPVTRSQLRAMTALAEDSLISMGSLCSIAKVKLPSLTEVVDRFEKQGILARVRDNADRRVVRVRFTEKGKKMHRTMLQRREEELKGVFGPLTRKERADLGNALETITALLNKMLAGTAKQRR